MLDYEHVEILIYTHSETEQGDMWGGGGVGFDGKSHMGWSHCLQYQGCKLITSLYYYAYLLSVFCGTICRWQWELHQGIYNVDVHMQTYHTEVEHIWRSQGLYQIVGSFPALSIAHWFFFFSYSVQSLIDTASVKCPPVHHTPPKWQFLITRIVISTVTYMTDVL